MALPQTVFWRERKAGRLPIFPRTLNSESAAVSLVSGNVFPGIFIDEGKVYGHHNGMGRPHRTQAGGLVYHVLNRANRRAPIFNESGDYGAFFRALADAQAEHPMRLLAYCVLPNHWHLVLWPEQDRSLSPFVGWLTLTHTQRWHAYRGSAGLGHLYQGRFKSFAVEADDHLLALCRYVAEKSAGRNRFSLDFY